MLRVRGLVASSTIAAVTACGGSGGGDDRGFGGTGGIGGMAAAGGAVDGGGGVGMVDGGGGVGNAIGTGGTGGTGAVDGGMGQVGDGCDGTRPCAAGLVCAGAECAPGEGSCSSDVDCGGDTYCCRDDGCLTDTTQAPTCIPYGSQPRGDTNPDCMGTVEIGLFDPAVQCEWTAPPAGDPYPDHVNVLATPLVADLPNDSGAASEVVIVSYNYTDGGSESAQGSNPAYFGVIRILNGQTCEQLESIRDPSNEIIAASPPAIGDLDGDGVVEIVTHRVGGGVVAFRWNSVTRAYETFWAGTNATNTGLRWDGPAIHDLNDDGFPEVVSEAEVYDGRNGNRLNPGQQLATTNTAILSVLGDVDADGAVELVQDRVYRWNDTTRVWEQAYPGPGVGIHFAFADFGTPGSTPAEFDATTMDGRAEIVATGHDAVTLSTLDGQILLNVAVGDVGGPPTIGDFDNDGLPEIASAGGTGYRVFDLDCAMAGVPGCQAQGVRWERPSQDSSSARTGSSIFDFEGDGKAEAVYADECFVRIYAGDTGEVLYSSYRTSCTWYENPIVADPDRDSNTEIVVNSNQNCTVTCPNPGGAIGVPFVDPIHPGQRCVMDLDCVGMRPGSCVEGLCRCTSDAECSGDQTCVAPLPGTAGAGNVCRATHPNSTGLTGVRILKDRLDRWASSRPMWNQHAYSITNVNDDGTIPQTSAWMQNFTQSGLNNYRQNVQGGASSTDWPDITGRLDQENVCSQAGGVVTLTATVCNRGLKPVGADMPATFYDGDPATGDVLCVSYTNGPVPVAGCLDVSCEISDTIDGVVSMVVNDDGLGGQTTVECNDLNNTDTVMVTDCGPR